jgi:hypothetical protein
MVEELQPIGEVTHYFNRIGVAVIHLWDSLAIGDWVQIYGGKTNFIQQVESMQIDHQPIDEAFADQEIALQVVDLVQKGDWVYPYFLE